MKIKSIALLLCTMILAASSALSKPKILGFDIKALIDLRAIHSSDEKSWVDEGLGKTRYGSDNNEHRNLVSPSQLSLVLKRDLGDQLSFHSQFNLDIESGSHHLKEHIDLIETFFTLDNSINDRFWLKTKIGVFFPLISFEHPRPAWSTKYTLTPSAINTWIGEELRTIGLEPSLIYEGDNHVFTLQAAAYIGNDPAGSLLAYRGWALHDRQTGLWDAAALPAVASLSTGGVLDRQASTVKPFREIDDRLGFYVGGRWEMIDRGEFRLFYYDNQAQETQFNGFQYAWRTKFYSTGFKYNLPKGITLISQAMSGKTYMGHLPPGGFAVANDFRSWFILVSKKFRLHRLSMRYETFSVDDRDGWPTQNNNEETGRALTLAHIHQLARQWEVTTEGLRISSHRPGRQELNNRQTRQKEYQFQTSLRFRF